MPDLPMWTAFVTAIAALVAALTAMLVQLRGFRSDVVSAVEKHMAFQKEILDAISKNGINTSSSTHT